MTETHFDDDREPLNDAVELPRGIEAMFERYAAGFDDFDADAVLDCFRFPATLWQSGRGNVFADEDELLENVEALLAVFEREEIVRSVFTVVDDCTAERDVAYAVLDWRQERADGEAALEFRCRYTLAREETREGEDDWRIVLAVSD